MITQKQTMEAMQVLIGCGVPVLLWGDPGTGKTATVEQLAADNGWHIETVIASLHDPTDFGGLPVLTDNGVRFEPPAWARRVAEHEGRSVVFLDEVNCAAPSTQNALMKVVLSGMVGEFSLGDDVSFVAAANLPEQNPGAWDLSLPLANRFAHLDWPLTFVEYSDGVRTGFPVPPPVKVDTVDPSRLGWWRALQLGYLARRTGSLCDPPTDDTTGSRGWPSPRSWDRLVRVLTVAEQIGHARNSVVMMMLTESLVGEGVSAEFMGFIRDVDLPDPEELLADTKSFKLPKRLDSQYACLESVRAAVADNTTPDRWEAAWRICIAAAKKGAPDIAASVATQLVELRPSVASPAQPGFEVFAELMFRSTDDDEGR